METVVDSDDGENETGNQTERGAELELGHGLGEHNCDQKHGYQNLVHLSMIEERFADVVVPDDFVNGSAQNHEVPDGNPDGEHYDHHFDDDLSHLVEGRDADCRVIVLLRHVLRLRQQTHRQGHQQIAHHDEAHADHQTEVL